MNYFIESRGLVKESDIISLSPDFIVNKTFITDTANGAIHSISNKAYIAVMHITHQRKIDEWMWYMKQKHIADKQIYDLLFQLNNVGALKIRRSIVSRFHFFIQRIKYGVRGVHLQTLCTRESANIKGLCKIVGVALAPVGIIVLITSIVEYGANFNQSMYLITNSIFLIVLFLSTVLHEYVHIFLARNYSTNVTLIRKGLRLGVLHRTLPASNEITSVIAGPVTGFLFSVCMSYILFYYFDLLYPALFSVAVGIFHICSWLPNSGDGKVLLQFLKRGFYASKT